MESRDRPLHAAPSPASRISIPAFNTVEREVAADKPIHVVLDNYATHNIPQCYPASAPFALDLPLHPNPASWLTPSRTSFSKMTRQRIRRGVFRSIADLQAATSRRLSRSANNASPKAFVWTTNPPMLFSQNSNVALYHYIRLNQCTSSALSPPCLSPKRSTSWPLVRRRASAEVARAAPRLGETGRGRQAVFSRQFEAVRVEMPGSLQSDKAKRARERSPARKPKWDRPPVIPAAV